MNSALPPEERYPDDLSKVIGDHEITEAELNLYKKLYFLKQLLFLQGRDPKYESIDTSINTSKDTTPLHSLYPVKNQKGGFASRLECCMIRNQDQVRFLFIKHITVSPANEDVHNLTLINSFQKEVEFGKKCRDHDTFHENVVKIEDAFIECLDMSIVYEYISGQDLDDMIHKVNASYVEEFDEEFLTLKRKMFIAYHFAKGLKFLHTKMNTAHRDIKPANIMCGLSTNQLSIDMEITCLKIIDLGGVKEVNEDKTQTMNGKTLGTTRYRAPFGGTFFQDDMYSFGMTLWELFAEEKPFHSELSTGTNTTYSMFDISSFVAASDNNRPNIGKCKNCPQVVKDLISQCWKRNANERPDISTAYYVIKNAYYDFTPKKRPREE